jgi:hypothetical protein
MTEWRAFAAWSIQIRKCWTFRLDQCRLLCAIIRARYPADVGHPQATKRADSQVAAADARAHIRHMPAARRRLRARSWWGQADGDAVGRAAAGMGVSAIPSRRELPIASRGWDCRHGCNARADHRDRPVSLHAQSDVSRTPRLHGGLALTFWSWFAVVLLVARAIWFQRRVLQDERRLEKVFGAEYSAHRARVRRWIPFAL